MGIPQRSSFLLLVKKQGKPMVGIYPANKVGKRFLGATWDRALDLKKIISIYHANFSKKFRIQLRSF